ncbi:MAG: glycosyltransferase family 4 protein [Gammaproteobacteria bacterium]|nr:glycosyltransferase family 4 protein [Gammaproteobacteria bacterium]
MKHHPRLLYFVTEDWYFCSHRLNLALAAQCQGFEIHVLTRVSRHGDIILSKGFNLIPLDIERGSTQPVRELKTIFQVWRHYVRIKPDIVHHIALKPAIYGGFVSLFIPKLKTVSLIAGLGSIFSSNSLKARLLKPFVKWVLRFLFNSNMNRIVVQNTEDRGFLIDQLKVNAENVVLIKGSGVDIKLFQPTPEPDGQVIVALVSRLLWNKGIGEYVEAIRILKQRGLIFNAVLVGEPDDENIASVDRSQLEAWQQLGLIEWLVFQENVAAFWQTAHIAVLPSYREGLPKSLLEAAACGRPIVTTDTSGCKEVVQNGLNGFLVKVGDSVELADALEKLILNADLRQKMGRAGRKLVEQEFSDQKIIAKTLAVYQELI